MKSYPRTRFEIINNTSVEEISTNTVTGTTSLMMGAYTSDKGSEDWELLAPNNGITDFTTRKGGLNFTKHGQGQFTIANLLRNGSYVLAKRMVSDDATLANVTIKARVVVVDKVSYVYLYGTSAENIKTFKDAYEAGYASFDPDALPQEVTVDENGNVIPNISTFSLGRTLDNEADAGVTNGKTDSSTTTPDQGGSSSESTSESASESESTTGSESGSETPSEGKDDPIKPELPTASDLFLVITSISTGYTNTSSTDENVAAVNSELTKIISDEKKGTIISLSDINLDSSAPAQAVDGKYEVELGITSVKSTDNIIALHKIGSGDWEQIVPTKIADGSVTIQVSSFSPIAIIKIEDANEPDVPVVTKDALIYDIPLFTVTMLGRGKSSITVRLIPEYFASKSTRYMKYTFEVSENANVLESISCTFNPDAIIDSIIQSIQNKVNNASGQVKVKIFEDGILKLTKVLAETATRPDEVVSIDEVTGNKIVTTVDKPISYTELINLDYINGYDKKENPINGIITKNIADTISADEENLWVNFKPSDITPFALNVAEGIKLTNGTNGAMGDAPVQNTEEYTKMLLGTFGKNINNSNFDPVIYDLDRYKVDAIFDCGYPMEVKNAIVDMVDFRGDMVFLADLGTELTDLDSIIDRASSITKSKYVAIYHNYFNIKDDFTKKEITVTMPYLLAPRLINHISTGVGKPFAGIANGITFPEIIEGTINFLPVVIPGLDQKQLLADASVNYMSYYDGLPVMEAMWTNDDAYTQLSFLHNVMGVQEVVKVIRDRCPKTRYTFLDGDDLKDYLDDANSIIREYKSNFKSISMTYMADEKYESNNIFYAVIKVQFHHFVNEEYFKVIAID